MNVGYVHHWNFTSTLWPCPSQQGNSKLSRGRGVGSRQTSPLREGRLRTFRWILVWRWVMWNGVYLGQYSVNSCSMDYVCRRCLVFMFFIGGLTLWLAPESRIFDLYALTLSFPKTASSAQQGGGSDQTCRLWEGRLRVCGWMLVWRWVLWNAVYLCHFADNLCRIDYVCRICAVLTFIIGGLTLSLPTGKWQAQHSGGH